MSPNRKLSRQACLLLFVVSQRYRLKSINYFRGEHGKTLKLHSAVVTLKVIKILLIIFSLQTMYKCKFG